jgi:gliding motility-associated lipoprotein GldD
MLYNIKGNTASSVQFYLTDSVNHFLRGSLYFDVKPNKDSLAPVINFIRGDIEHFMESFSWK